jgi:hypothetical protein
MGYFQEHPQSLDRHIPAQAVLHKFHIPDELL